GRCKTESRSGAVDSPRPFSGSGGAAMKFLESRRSGDCTFSILSRFLEFLAPESQSMASAPRSQVGRQKRLDGRPGGISAGLPTKFPGAGHARKFDQFGQRPAKILSSHGCPFLRSSGAFVVERATAVLAYIRNNLPPEKEIRHEKTLARLRAR